MLSLLVLDFGNTRLKAARFDGTNFVEEFNFPVSESETAIRELIGKYMPEFTAAVSVKSGTKVQLQQILADAGKQAPFIIDAMTRLPFENAYQSKTTLGMDRVMGVAGALKLVGDGPLLVIDAGTALTFDFLDGNNIYRGGGISPGLSMRFRALHEFTDQLPLITADENPALVGTDTASSIRSGVINGFDAEVSGIAERYMAHTQGRMKIVLTGGDAGFLRNRMEKSTFVSSNLLLHGIQSVFAFNHAE